MESISKKLGLLLEGKPYEEMFEFCDFSLNEQNEASQAKGIQVSKCTKEKPVSSMHPMSCQSIQTDPSVFCTLMGHFVLIDMTCLSLVHRNPKSQCHVN